MLAPTLHPTSFVSPRAMSDTEDCERPTAAPISCCVMPHPIRSVTSSFHFIGNIIASPITKVNRKTDIKPREHTRMKKRPTRKPSANASKRPRSWAPELCRRQLGLLGFGGGNGGFGVLVQQARKIRTLVGGRVAANHRAGVPMHTVTAATVSGFN